MPPFPSLRFLSFVATLALIMSAPLRAQSVVSTWNTAGDNWSDPSAWLSGTPPISGNSTALIFGGSVSYNANNDLGNFTVSQIQFTNTASTAAISASSVSTILALANSDAQLGVLAVTGTGNATMGSAFTWSGEDSINNNGPGTLAFNGSTLTFANGTKQAFTNSGGGSIAFADAVTYANAGAGTGVVLNFTNNNSTFGSFSIGNMGGLTNVTFTIGGTGTVNFVTGGNTSTGDLFSNSAVLNVLGGATFDFNGNGETFGAIEGAGAIHATVGMQFVATGNYNFSGLITGTAGNMTVDAANTYQTISGANSNYTGNTSVLGGHLIVDANAPNGGTGVVGALGNSTLAVNMGDTSGSLSSFLMIGVPGVTIGRNIQLQTGNTGVVTIGGLNLSGTAIFGGNITMGTASAAAKGVTLSAAPGGTVQFTGNLLRATGATGTTDTLTVTGGGTVTLSGINTFTGAATVNAGTLVLDNSTNNGNKISATAALTLNGGSLSYMGSSTAPSSQSVTGLTLGNSASPPGGSATFAITTGANQNATFALGAITRNTGATIDFEATNTGTGVTDITTSNVNTTGILGAYATFGQGDWAANDGNGNIVAYSSVGTYVTTFGTGNQTSLNTNSIIASGGGTANSLRFASALALTFTTGTDTLTLISGGLLIAPGTGTTSIGTTTTRGNLASGTNGELIVQQQSTSGTLTLNSNISATTLTKSGAGTLALSGANSMTAVIVDAGTLSVTATGNLGAAASAITLDGGTLAVPSGSMGTVSSTGHTVIIGPDGGTLNFTANITFSGNGFSGTGTVTKTGAGTWSVGSNSSSFSGAININQGTLSMTSSQLNSSGTVAVASGATFNINDDGIGSWFTNNGTQFLLNGSGVGGTTGAIHLTDQTTNVAVFADPTSTLLRDVVLQTSSLIQVDNGVAAGSLSTFIFGGNVSGPGALIVGGTGVVALTGRENSYGGGTFVNSGTLRVSGGNDRLPTGTSVNLGANGGGVLQLFGNTQTIAGLTTANAGVNDEVTNGNGASTSPGILTVNLASGSQTYDGTLGGAAGTADNTHTNNYLSFVKDGAGTLALTGSNTYNGYTTVVNGTLQMGNVNALGNSGSSLNADNGGTTVNAGAALDLNGASGVNEVITLNGSGLAGTGALINSNTGTTASLSSGVSSLSLTGVTTTGWSSTASVSIGAPGGSGTQAGAAPLLGLTTSSINITNGGSGYSTSSTPVITVTGGGGTGAVLVPSLGLTSSSYTVTSGTQTYSVAPTVTITGQGAGGTAATGTAILDGTGKVIGITLTNPGAGFTAAPTVTFSGGTVLAAGTAPTASGSSTQFTLVGIVVVNSGNGFTSVPTITITGNATLQSVDGNFVLNGIAVTNNGGGYTSTPTVSVSGGVASASANLGSVILATDSSIGGAGNLTINSVISGSGAFNKVGTGTTVLTGANAYTGATNVTAGNLQVGVAGSGTTGTGNVTVNGSGTVLSGTGTVNGSTNIILGTIKPGDNGGASTGTLNMQSLTFSPASASTVAVLQITGSAANSNLSSDKIVVNGVLTLSANSNITVDGTGYTPKVGDTFDLLDWTSLVANGFNFGSNLRTGANSAGNEGNLDLPDVTGTGVWNIATSGNSLIASIVSVPEPSRAMLLVIGVAGALLRRRRR